MLQEFIQFSSELLIDPQEKMENPAIWTTLCFSFWSSRCPNAFWSWILPSPFSPQQSSEGLQCLDKTSYGILVEPCLLWSRQTVSLVWPQSLLAIDHLQSFSRSGWSQWKSSSWVWSLKCGYLGRCLETSPMQIYFQPGAWRKMKYLKFFSLPLNEQLSRNHHSQKFDI